MTGAQTDPVTTPMYILTASALLRLAAGFFPDAMKGDSPVSLDLWVRLRKTAEVILDRRGLSLTVQEEDILIDCLKACPPDHDRALVVATILHVPEKL